MQGAVRMERQAQHRGIGCRWCGGRATYRRKNGETVSRKDHDLCVGCFKQAKEIGRNNAHGIMYRR